MRSSRGCPCPARPAIAARSPPRPPGSARSSRSSCAGSSPASPSAPAAHSAWPRGSASCSCGSSCRVTSWFRDDPGAARFLPPVRPLPDPGGGGGTKTSFAPARRLYKVAFQKIHSLTTSRASGWACVGRLPRPLRPLAISHWPPSLWGPPSHTPGLRHVGKVKTLEAPPCCGPASPAPPCGSRHFRQPAVLSWLASANLRVGASCLLCPVGRFSGLFSPRGHFVARGVLTPFCRRVVATRRGAGETARAGLRAPARAAWQPGDPAPSPAPGLPGGHRLPSDRAWSPRACGPGQAFSVLGGAGPGS